MICFNVTDRNTNGDLAVKSVIYPNNPLGEVLKTFDILILKLQFLHAKNQKLNLLKKHLYGTAMKMCLFLLKTKYLGKILLMASKPIICSVLQCGCQKSSHRIHCFQGLAQYL